MREKPRKIQVLRAYASADDDHLGADIPKEALHQLLDLAEAINDYFGRRCPPGFRREGRDKFNRVMEARDKFDFGTYAPDELRADDYE